MQSQYLSLLVLLQKKQTAFQQKEGYNPNGAAAAAYSIFKGYQHLSRSWGRSPERALSVDSFDGWNNIMRFDMVYSAAGIRFAMGKATNKEVPISIDEGVKLILKKSNDTDRMSKTESRKLFSTNPRMAFIKWNFRFSPDSVFKLYNGK